MKNFNGIRKVKTIVFLFLACFLMSSGIAFSADSQGPEDMVMIPGGHFLMGVDKEVNVDTEKMSLRQKLRYAVSREAFHDEGPAHNVIIDAFFIDQYEV